MSEIENVDWTKVESVSNADQTGVFFCKFKDNKTIVVKGKTCSLSRRVRVTKILKFIFLGCSKDGHNSLVSYSTHNSSPKNGELKRAW
jgi:hypothetical protein